MVSDSSMRKTPPFLYSCTLQWILKQGKGCFTELGLVKRRVSLFTVWLTCSEENLRLLSASSFFKRQVCSPKTSVDMLRALKLTLTRQFTGISLSTRSGTNYRTAARVFFALSPSSLPPCQWSQTKEIVLGAQQTLLIVLMGCNCSSRTAANHNTACKKQCEPAEFCSQSSKVTLAKKIEWWRMWNNCFGEHHSPLEHGILSQPLIVNGVNMGRITDSSFLSVFGCSPVFLSSFQYTLVSFSITRQKWVACYPPTTISHLYHHFSSWLLTFQLDYCNTS